MRSLSCHACALAVVVTAAVVCVPASGHEIPSDVTIRIIVHPAADHVDILVRAPLEAMQDIDFPQTGDGFLDVARAAPLLADAAVRWLGRDIHLLEAGSDSGPLELVSARASIPSDRSFSTFETARAHITGQPIRAGTPLVWQQALLDAWFRAPSDSATSAFALSPDLGRLGLAVAIAIRFEPADGPSRVYEVDGNSLTGPIELDPSWRGAALRFIGQGFGHILDGLDHLLFLLCLVLPLRRDLGGLVKVVTAFTVAHSVTLIGSAYGLAPDALWFAPLIETLIALSIVFMAIENVLFGRGGARWLIASGFGLVHGFGFSFALRNTLQFAGDHVLTSLLSFNIGVELGQLAVLAVLVPALNLIFRFVPERAGVIVISVLVGHTAWHWMTERYAALAEFPAPWSQPQGSGRR